MMYKLTYTAALSLTDSQGNPAGDLFRFNGQQLMNTNAPQNSDIVAVLALMSTDLTTQIEAGFPLQSSQDSDQAGSGGAG